MLNPVALFRSASFRSASPSLRFLPASSAARDHGGGYDSGSDVSDESCMISGSHQSTLERLFAWEKKLYEEVKVINQSITDHASTSTMDLEKTHLDSVFLGSLESEFGWRMSGSACS